MSLIQMSVSAAFLIAVVTIIRFIAMHRLPKRFMLIIWAVVLCRLLIPFSVPAETSVFNFADTVIRRFGENTGPVPPAEDAVSKINTAPEVPATEQGEQETKRGDGSSAWHSGLIFAFQDQAEEPSPRLVVPSPLMLIWLAGALTAISFFVVSYSRCRRRFKVSRPACNCYVTEWQARHKLKRPWQVRVTDGVSTPLTYGVFRPVIMLPGNFDLTDEERLDYILTHELIHINRFDALTKLLITAAVCMHWFNPFVWLMVVLYNRDIEISCDESVIRAVGAGSKSAYALTLIEMAEKGNKPTLLFSGFSRHAIEDRVKSIMKLRKSSVAATVAAVVIIVGAIVVFATSANEGTATDAGPEASAAQDAATGPALDTDNERQANDPIKPESADNSAQVLPNVTPMEISIPKDTDELNEMFDFSKLGTVFFPDGLHDAGGSLLFDEDYNYSVQFPKEWFFYNSAAMSEASLALYTAFAEDPAFFAKNLGLPPPADETFIKHFTVFEDDLIIENFPHSAVFSRTRQSLKDLGFRGVPPIGVVQAEAFLKIHYRNFSPSLISFDEAARLEWASNYDRYFGVGGETSRLGEIEAVNINGAYAYRYLIRFDHSEYSGGISQEYEYLVAISDDAYAVFSMKLSGRYLDNAEFEKFHRAMETFKRRT